MDGTFGDAVSNTMDGTSGVDHLMVIKEEVDPIFVPLTFTSIKSELDEDESTTTTTSKSLSDGNVRTDKESLTGGDGGNSGNDQHNTTEENCDSPENTASDIASGSTAEVQSEQEFKCDVCPQKFTKEMYLTTHERTHTHIRPFRCDACGIVVTSGISLKRHLDIHIGNLPFKCSECDKAFPSNSGLRKHKAVHLETAEFQCEICKRRYTQKATLTTHMNMHKTGKDQQVYHCKLCSFKSVHSSHIRSHMVSYHVPYVNQRK